MHILDLNRLRLQSGKVEGQRAPIRVADTEQEFLLLLELLCSIATRTLLDSGWATTDSGVFSRDIREKDYPLKLVFVFQWCIIKLKLRQDRMVEGHSLLCIHVVLEVGHLNRRFA